jgi:hypothetical protein
MLTFIQKHFHPKKSAREEATKAYEAYLLRIFRYYRDYYEWYIGEGVRGLKDTSIYYRWSIGI